MSPGMISSRDDLEVDVGDRLADRVTLNLPGDHEVALGADREVEERGTARRGEGAAELAGVDRDRHRLAAVAVEDAGICPSARSLRAAALPRSARGSSKSATSAMGCSSPRGGGGTVPVRHTIDQCRPPRQRTEPSRARRRSDPLLAGQRTREASPTTVDRRVNAGND